MDNVEEGKVKHFEKGGEGIQGTRVVGPMAPQGQFSSQQRKRAYSKSL